MRLVMKRSLFFVALFVIGLKCDATHLAGGEIYAERVHPTSLTFKITIRVYTNLIGTNVLFGGDSDWLDFGDGQRILVPETPNVIRQDLGEGRGMASFTIVHTYATPSTYQIMYSEPNWEEGIINFDGSVNTPFFLEATINALPGYTASPKFLQEPFIIGILGQPFSMALTAKDTNDYRLTYELVIPKYTSTNNVINYKFPETAKLHRVNGLFEWDTKFNDDYLSGVFLFCVKVSQYDSENRLVGSVVRNFIVTLNEIEAELSFQGPDELDENKAIFEPEGNSQALLFSADGDYDRVTFQIRSELTSIPGAIEVIDDATLRAVEIVLHSLPEINRKNPYAIVVRARFEHADGISFRDFALSFYTQDPITGIGEESSKKHFVYPNPVSTILHFDDGAIEQKARIVDMSGKVVFTKERNERTLDVSLLAPGSYFVIPEKRGMNIQLIIKR
jgi:hypothetical protein